jgi:hypothetical protein
MLSDVIDFKAGQNYDEAHPAFRGERQPIRSHHFRSALKLSPTLLIFVAKLAAAT